MLSGLRLYSKGNSITRLSWTPVFLQLRKTVFIFITPFHLKLRIRIKLLGCMQWPCYESLEGKDIFSNEFSQCLLCLDAVSLSLWKVWMLEIMKNVIHDILVFLTSIFDTLMQYVDVGFISNRKGSFNEPCWC